MIVSPGEHARPEPGYRIIRWHKLMAVLTGEGRLHYPGGCLSIRAGQLVIVPPHFPHRMERVAIRGKYAQLFLAPKTREIYYNVHLREREPSTDRAIRGGECELRKSPLILALADELISLKERQGPMYEGLTLSLLAVLQGEFARGESASGSALIHRCQSYVEQELSDPLLAVTGIAEHLRVNPDYLSREFHAETGVRLASYIQTCRIQLAKELLADGKLFANEVSHLAGFSDSGYFAKVFRRLVGTTPSEYRQRSVANIN